MVEVYFYIPADRVAGAVECGIKLSEWYSREIVNDGDRKKYISALLNPRDDVNKYNSAEYVCLKLEIMTKYCRIAEGALYGPGLADAGIMELYNNSIVSVEEYRFGQFRQPECLVSCTVLGEHINVLDKRLDSPILFDNSEELYLGNILEEFKELHPDFNDALLHSLFMKLVEKGSFNILGKGSDMMEIFIDRRDGRVYTVKIPDIGSY